MNGGGANINTSPQLCHTILDQLINVVNVAQSDIGIGDPSHNMDDATLNECSPDFPNVIYWRIREGFTSEKNPIVGSESDVLFASDGGKSNKLPQSYLDAAYMINLPVFKKHHRAGISLCAKNHFGSVAYFNSNGAFDWHYSLPCPDGGADVSNGEYGQYRCFVDIMAHKDLGGKTVLYLVDGLWSSINWGHPPIKWRMAPFNTDYPNSLFFSQDPVAIESVCYDFLYYEFDENHPTEGAYDPRDDHGPFPHYAGADDYLRQAADAANRPAGFVYDPEKDGTPIPASLGVYEHWNNADEKKYSRNLGLDTGIELLQVEGTSVVRNPDTDQAGTITGFRLEQNYPNPFNPSTSIRYQLDTPAQISLAVFQVNGQLVRTLYSGTQSAGVYIQQWDGQMKDGLPAPSGVYLCRIVVEKDGGVSQQVRKMTLSR